MVTLPFLGYADDVALMCSNPTTAQSSVNRLYIEARKVGLQVSASKTEVLHIGFPNATSLTLPDGQIIKSVSDFVYLGSKVASSDAPFNN